MNIILFGPPGVGKSTLIGALKTEGFSAIDLEDLYPNRIRFAIPNYVDNTFLGAADLSPQREYNNAIKVLLYMSQSKYESRRAQRDSKHVEKKNQMPHNIDDWYHDTEWNWVVDVSQPLKQVVRELSIIMKEATRRENK